MIEMIWIVVMLRNGWEQLWAHVSSTAKVGFLQYIVCMRTAVTLLAVEIARRTRTDLAVTTGKTVMRVMIYIIVVPWNQKFFRTNHYGEMVSLNTHVQICHDWSMITLMISVLQEMLLESIHCFCRTVSKQLVSKKTINVILRVHYVTAPGIRADPIFFASIAFAIIAVALLFTIYRAMSGSSMRSNFVIVILKLWSFILISFSIQSSIQNSTFSQAKLEQPGRYQFRYPHWCGIWLTSDHCLR